MTKMSEITLVVLQKSFVWEFSPPVVNLWKYHQNKNLSYNLKRVFSLWLAAPVLITEAVSSAILLRMDGLLVAESVEFFPL